MKQVGKCKGLRFNSPTINTLIYGEEFINFVNDIENYLKADLLFYSNSEGYPIGKLVVNNKVIHIHFLHNKTFDEAKLNWDRRKVRVDLDNLFIIYEHFNNYSDDIVYNFGKLKYNKVVFTHKKFNNLKHSQYIAACKKEKSFGTITKFKNKLSGKRNIYKFNFIKKFNNIKKEKAL